MLRDLGLPGMSGYEVATCLRRIDGGQSLRIVAVTGYGDDERRQRSREAGFDEHLVKPVEPERLARILAECP